MPRSNRSLFVAIKPKAKHIFRTAAMFFTLYRKMSKEYLHMPCMSEICYHKKFQEVASSGASVALISNDLMQATVREDRLYCPASHACRRRCRIASEVTVG